MSGPGDVRCVNFPRDQASCSCMIWCVFSFVHFLTLDVMALNKREECPVGEVPRGSPRETSASYIGLEPDLIPHKPLRLITEHPHLVQEALAKPDLHASDSIRSSKIAKRSEMA